MMSDFLKVDLQSANGTDGRHWRRRAWMLYPVFEASNNGI
jgi:hypothetical protein